MGGAGGFNRLSYLRGKARVTREMERGGQGEHVGVLTEAETKGGGWISTTTMASVLLLGSCHGVLQGRQTTGSGALDAARRRAAPGGACSRRR
jgi:hypothetical protein